MEIHSKEFQIHEISPHNAQMDVRSSGVLDKAQNVELTSYKETRPTPISRVRDLQAKNDLEWLRMTFNDLEWPKMTKIDLKWLKNQKTKNNIK